jgi:hypothetical protein
MDTRPCFVSEIFTWLNEECVLICYDYQRRL